MSALPALAPVLVTIILLVAGIAKLIARTNSTVDGHLPNWLTHRVIQRSHPWVEIITAIALVVGSNWVSRIAALLALALTVGYITIVLHLYRQDTSTDCDCFGDLDRGEVTGRTIARNVWLLLLALASVAVLWGGTSVAGLLSQTTSGWSLLGAAVLTAVTGALFAPSATALPAGSTALADDEEPGEYVRTRTPAIPVILADGDTVTLLDLARTRAQLLLFVSTTCAVCLEIMAKVPAWRANMPLIDIRLVFRENSADCTGAATEEPQTLHDPDSWASTSFGLNGYPSALLLGIDGYLAGGPVVGGAAVAEFVEEVQAELASV